MFDSLSYLDINTQEVFYQNNLSAKDKQTLLLSGKIKDKAVFILDENSNGDFRDDSVRTLVSLKSKLYKVILCKYMIDAGNGAFIDSSWFKIGIDNNRIVGNTFQHLSSSFMIDRKKYRIEIVDINSYSFCFLKPRFYLIEENGIKRDTLLLRDIFKKGEYIKLGNNHYKIHEFYNGCGSIVLTKANNYDKLEGAQVGMLFPGFRCQTINGDTIISEDLIVDKPLLVANISGCYPNVYELMKNLEDSCKDSLNILWLEYEVGSNWQGSIVDVAKNFNEALYINYRNSYSSYDCYLVDPDGKIIDKFNLFDWKVNLLHYITD